MCDAGRLTMSCRARKEARDMSHDKGFWAFLDMLFSQLTSVSSSASASASGAAAVMLSSPAASLA